MSKADKMFEELGYKKSLAEASKAGFKYVDFDATEHNDCDVKDEEIERITHNKQLIPSI